MPLPIYFQMQTAALSHLREQGSGDQATEAGANGSTWAEGISSNHRHRKCASTRPWVLLLPDVQAEQKEHIEEVL